MMDYQRLLEAFLVESRELLDELERDVLALAQGAGEETLNEVYRRMHTLKGSASCVSLEAMTRAAHHCEDAVSTALSTRRGGDPALAGLLLHAIDVLAHLVDEAAAHRDEPDDPRISALGARCARWLDAATPATVEAPVSPMVAARLASAPQTIRVEVTRLDRAMELAAGLTVARGRLGDAFARADLSRISPALEAADSLIHDLELQILQLRLVPLRDAFERLRRAVHDLGEATGKSVQLELRCDDVEVDIAAAEALRAPLTHLIRNAIDHGVEAPHERIARGKPTQGRIVIAARRDRGQLVVEVRDDGRGLDRDRLVARARAMGVAADHLSDAQVWELTFVAGLSTAEEVGDLSGRGIGMDVVRRSIEAMRGSIHLASVAGEGVTATIHVPQALSIIHGLAVGVGEEVFVLPVDSVLECVELERDRAICSVQGGVLELRGDALPYLRLAEHFGARSRDGARTTVVVVEHDGKQAGIEVDALLGEVQTVIKPMTRLFAGVSGIAGTSVLGDGRIALVVDVRGVLRMVTAVRAAA